MKNLLCCLLMLVAWNVRADSKECPKCGKNMIKTDTGMVLTSYPPQYPWYWYCGCGNTEEGGIRTGATVEESRRECWEIENDPCRSYSIRIVKEEETELRLAALEKLDTLLQQMIEAVNVKTKILEELQSRTDYKVEWIMERVKEGDKSWKELYEEQKGGKK